MSAATADAAQSDYFPADLSPAENIQYGVAFIAEKLDQYAGNVGAALTAYNAGHDTGNREMPRRSWQRRKGGEQNETADRRKPVHPLEHRTDQEPRDRGKRPRSTGTCLYVPSGLRFPAQ